MLSWILGLAILFMCFATGRKVIGFLKVPLEPDEEIVLGTGLGLGLLAYGVLLTGLLHKLSSSSLWGLLALLLVLTLLDFKGSFRTLQRGLEVWKTSIARL